MAQRRSREKPPGRGSMHGEDVAAVSFRREEEKIIDVMAPAVAAAVAQQSRLVLVQPRIERCGLEYVRIAQEISVIAPGVEKRKKRAGGARAMPLLDLDQEHRAAA